MDMRLNPILSIVLMFALTQIIGIAAGILLTDTAAYDENVQSLSISPIGDTQSPLNALLMLGYVLIGAGAALFIIKYFRTKFFFRLIELAVVGGTVSILLFAFIFAFGPLDFFGSVAISSAAGAIFAIAKFFIPKLKNPAAILSSAGVAAIFGFSMGIWPALIFIVALSLYDYIAVFKTRHMLTLAQGLGTNELSFTVTATDGQGKPAGEKIVSGERVSRLDLGSGDLAIPAMLAVSVYSATGILGSIAVLIGSIISIYITLKFVVEKHIVLPALPPICLGSLIALLISQAIALVVPLA